jgi:hypothetical protein
MKDSLSNCGKEHSRKYLESAVESELRYCTKSNTYIRLPPSDEAIKYAVLVLNRTCRDDRIYTKCEIFPTHAL